MTLNILFMTRKRDDLVCLDYGHYFEQAVGKIANCAWAGRGWPDYHSERLNFTVKRVMPDADWVIYYDFEVRHDMLNPRIPSRHNRKYNVATIVSDIHKEPRNHIVALKRGRWDALLMLYTQLGAKVEYENGIPIVMNVNPNLFLDELNAPIFRLTPSIDPTAFNMVNSKRDIDALFLGNVTSPYYPLRNAIYPNLMREGERNNWKTISKWSPPGKSFERKKKDYLTRGEIVGEKYADYLSRTKCFLFGTSVSKYPLLKFFEAMASGACVLADTPLLAEELHLKPGENFVNIDVYDWREKLKYYLNNDKERRRVALEGYKMTMKYHTNHVRALELIKFLEIVLRR